MIILQFTILLVLMNPRGLSAVKMLKFADDRNNTTGAKITVSKPDQVTDFTFCLDFEVTLIKDFRIISTQDTNDLEILIPNSLDQIQIAFKGIWYIAFTDQVEPYNSSY